MASYGDSETESDDDDVDFENLDSVSIVAARASSSSSSSSTSRYINEIETLLQYCPNTLSEIMFNITVGTYCQIFF